eukprot:GFUD01122883.1.p1 GENE.GFUD01122883.1~~GFUD01122883.1.p1  ORF type:complete len:133 (-),score=10.65 GFUD01122883.1:228-626(-)
MFQLCLSSLNLPMCGRLIPAKKGQHLGRKVLSIFQMFPVFFILFMFIIVQMKAAIVCVTVEKYFFVSAYHCSNKSIGITGTLCSYLNKAAAELVVSLITITYKNTKNHQQQGGIYFKTSWVYFEMIDFSFFC